MRTSTLFSVKNFGFFEIYGVTARKRGVEPLQTFIREGEIGVIFSLFCGDVFDGWPLIVFIFCIECLNISCDWL